MKHIMSALLVLFCANTPTLSRVWAAHSEKAPHLAQVRLAAFTCEKERLTDVIHRLSRTGGVGICVEAGVLFGSREVKRVQAGPAPDYKTERRAVTMDLKDVSIADVLDRLVEVAPGYTWVEDPATSMVNFYPMTGSPVSVHVHSLKIDRKTLNEAVEHSHGLSHVTACVRR